MFKRYTEELNITEVKLWLDFLEDFMNEKSYSLDIILKFSVYIIFFVSLFGNLLTCVVIYCERTMHTTTNYYLFNLGISDLIVSFAIFIDELEPSEFPAAYRHLACKIYFFFVIALWNNGILILAAIAIERYLGICYPFKLQSKTGWRSVAKIFFIIWIIALLEALPEAYMVELVILKNNQICFTVPTPMAKVINGVMGLLCFIIPLGIMIFVYTMIAFEVNIVQKNASGGKKFNHRDYRRKVNKHIITLTLSFLLCWLPFFMTRIIFFFNIHQIMKIKFWWRLLYNMTTICNWFSTVLNPLLFSLISTKFRKALKKLWNKKIKKQRSENVPTMIEME